MKREMPFDDHVEILSDDSADDEVSVNMASTNNLTIDQPAKEITSQGIVNRRAQMYQEYMKQMRIPSERSSVIPFTSWMGLAKSMKQLYGQPLHYLTNMRLRQMDQLRMGAEDDDVPLDSILHPCKAEASIWLMEEVHRLSTSSDYLAKLWLADPMHHAFIDPFSST